MLRSALTESLPVALEAQVCVVGGGPAGIVTALELARLGVAVVLIEAGGKDGPGAGETSYAGSSAGRPYPVQGSRLRWLGGTSNHWGGWVRPLDPTDFLDKPALELPAWPIRHADLQPWYELADSWCEVATQGYEFGQLGLEGTGRVFDLAAGKDFQNGFFRVSPPTRFGQRYRSEIAESSALDCWTDLTVVEMIQSADRVRQLRAVSTDGAETRIRADHFVLAMGGLEVPRLLLAQSEVPGNQSGLVGACFMDHFGIRPGRLLAAGGLMYRMFDWDGQTIIPMLRPAAQLLAGEALPNACIMLAATRPEPSLPPVYWSNQAISGLEEGEAMTYDVVFINEPVPDPRSRITLVDERDSFGLPRLQLHWQLPADSFQPALKLVDRFRHFVGQEAIGRFQWLQRAGLPEDQTPGIGYHHMGTTRMSATPDAGVTDPNCRIWDRENLYVASSSLFPTAGYANPTLTICALASRLARHLADKFEQQS
ncbi:MAG: GMC family oxidoreductase [Wenzhouxiangella sp.]|nr:GMC family oxidoreductase [Wenzhouxiangella sp.]TVR94306.1 MAG: GMC family oxidoreductase [Wenzhouxiangellaceae bacterium]